MEGSGLHTPPFGVRRVLHWYEKAHIDYAVQYMHLYVAYNAWYKEATGEVSDREAINKLKRRYVLWADYCDGKTLQSLRPYMKRLAEATQRHPAKRGLNTHWNGELANDEDWRSLIEYWYTIRCLIVHGEEVQEDDAFYAYETLSLFMGELIARMRACMERFDPRDVRQLSQLAEEDDRRSARFVNLQRKLYLAYVASPDVWQVDMQPVADEKGECSL